MSRFFARAGCFLFAAAIFFTNNPLCPAQSSESSGPAGEAVIRLLLQKLVLSGSSDDEFASSRITNNAARAAVAQAMEKSASVEEYYCAIEFSAVSNKAISWSKGHVAYRRPGHAYEQVTIIEDPQLGVTGQKQWTVTDGATVWQYIQNAPGSERELISDFQKRNMKKKTKDKNLGANEIAAVQRHTRPQVASYNLAILAKEKLTSRDLFGSFGIHDPWSLADPATLRIESEDDNTWVFTAKAASENEIFSSCRLTVGKANGLATKIETIGKEAATLVVSALHVNAEPKIDDKYFQSPLPPGVIALDSTNAFIRKTKNTMIAAGGKQGPAGIANSPFSGWYKIESSHAPLALNVRRISPEHGAVVFAWAYSANPIQNDEWRINMLADGHFEVINRFSGHALGIQNGSVEEGAPTIQSAAADESTRWKIEPVGNGLYRFTNAKSGLVMNVLDAGATNGTVITQAKWKGAPEQLWSIASLP